jgi:hypothetical protein
MIWGWRKLPKNCELGFADEAGNFVHDQRVPYSSTLYFIADMSKKIKVHHARKPNSKKTLLISDGIAFKGVRNESDFTPFDPADNSPTKVLYSRSGIYYMQQGVNQEYAYAIERILALTKTMPLFSADPSSGKIQNPTTDEK